MFTKIFLSILLSCFSAQTYSQVSLLIGTWRRVNPKLTVQDTIHKQLKYGDFEINQDSTFHIEGDSSTQNSTIPGWHVGDEYNGKWELDSSNHLTLYFDPKENKLIFRYIIIELNRNKLVLRLGFHKNDEKYDITYFRI